MEALTTWQESKMWLLDWCQTSDRPRWARLWCSLVWRFSDSNVWRRPTKFFVGGERRWILKGWAEAQIYSFHCGTNVVFFILKMTLENKNKWIKNEQKTSESHHLFQADYHSFYDIYMWISWIFEAPEAAVTQSILHLCKAGHKVYFEKAKDTQVLKQIHINNLHRDTNFGDVCAQYNTFCSIAVLCALILKGEKIRPLEVTD